MTELKRLFEFKTELEPAPGRLLVAHPLLEDPNFRRSVVLLTEYGRHGAMGFILNYPIEMEMIPGLATLDYELRCGGPVGEDSMFLLHNVDNVPNAVRVMDGLWIGGDIRKITTSDAHVVAFLGYAGWGYRQLDHEIREQTWAVYPATPDDVFLATPENLWEDVMCRMGDKYAYMTLFPRNPRLN
jgi:putative transcriptional regulator